MQRPELRGVLDAAELGDIECAVRFQFKAQHVIDPDMGDHRACQVRVLGQECPHQQAAIASSFHRQSCRAGVTPLDQVPGTSREVVEDILLAGEIAVEMPLGAVFAAATEIGHDIDPAAIKPQPQRAVELWPHAVTIAAVTLKECGIVAVERSALAAQDIDGNRVPSLLTANSRSTSMSLKSTGEVLAMAVLTELPHRRPPPDHRDASSGSV